MLDQVLIVAFGPVQGFVATARKTRDWTLGSRLLSTVVAAAARRLSVETGVNVIVPAPVPPSDGIATVANKIVAVLSGDLSPENIALKAREAAIAELTTIASGVRNSLGSRAIRPDRLWTDQIDRFLECAWAAVTLTSDGEFGRRREEAELLLEGRKGLRDFASYTGMGNREKSSIDGRLESVLDSPDRLRIQLGPAVLGPAEHLDAMGVIRRRWQPPNLDDVPSTAAIAVASWSRAVRNAAPHIAARVDQTRSALTDAIRAASGQGELAVFDADDSWALEEPPQRSAEIETLFDGAVPSTVASALQAFDSAAAELLKRETWTGRPSPYYVVLSADGDRIGRAFARLQTAEAHKQASLRLNEFAEGVAKLSRQHDVHLAYAGGDDLLALAPLDSGLPYVRAIYSAFAEAASVFESSPPTLSVGIAIVHARDSLRNSIELARRAERAAKDEGAREDDSGNRLAILLSKRSGEDVLHVMPFADRPEQKVGRLVEELQARGLPHGFAYEIARTAPLLATVDVDMARREIDRLLRRKRAGGGEAIGETVRADIMKLTGIESARSARELMDASIRLSALLRLAGHLAAHGQPPAGATPPTGVVP